MKDLGYSRKINTKFILRLLSGALLPVLFVSCNGLFASHETANLLDSASLYNTEAVLHFVRTHSEAGKKSAAYFSKGVDQYRNKKNRDAAYDLFVQSISLQPTARAYYELGNVSLEKKQYQHAIDAYKIAEQLGYEPVSKLFYNIACAYSLEKKENESANYLEYAIEAGYTNLKQMLADSDLDYIRQYYSFQESYQDAMSGASDPEVTLWQSFKREFKTAAMPVVLNLKTPVDETKNINFEFEKFVSEMRNEKFSRDVGKEFYYYAIVEDNTNYTALIYAIKNTVMSENAPCSYVLVSFDSKGILIDKKPVGGQLELDKPYLVCTLQPNLHFEIKQFKNVYQKDTEKEGYDNNPIVKSDLIGTEYYKIDENGKFVQLTKELAVR